MRALIGNVDLLCDYLSGAQALVGSKEEYFVFLYRSAEAGAKLVPAKRGRFVPIGHIACFKFVVTKELENRAMERIRARAAGGIDDGSITSELRAITIRQDLKLRDGFHTQRGSDAARTGYIPPPAQHILTI